MEKNKNIINKLIETFLKAGELSLELRRKGLIKSIKEDNTPVTNGDMQVNELIIEEIRKNTPSFPIVSEENSENKSNIKLSDFWLVDPIDGTYDYLNNRDEFTLNAALIIKNSPVLGIIYAPAKKRLFYSYGKDHSFEINDGKKIKLTCQKKSNKDEVIAVSYSDKLKPEIKDLHEKFKVSSYKKMKSSLKFCVIASGEYDLYVAEPRACEWDIAAGHAILENAGGIVTDFQGNYVKYGKEKFVNPSIILKRSNLLNE